MKIDSHLEERSKLSFFFPGVDRPRVLNFMENIKLDETSQGLYSEYNPIGRNGSVFVYLGSKSRTISLDFTLTLPNIVQYTRFPYSKDFSTYEKRAEIREEYFKKAQNDGFKQTKQTPASNIADLVNSFDLDFLSHLDDSEISVLIRKIGLQNAQGLLATNEGAIRNARTEAIGKILMWVNLVRSSVFTNSQNPAVGPPIVRLTHGILYQNVPCIVTGYRIGFDKESSYDQRTLLPRKINLSLDLREVRTSYTSFKSGDAITSDGAPGWDSIVEGGNATLDPIGYNHITTTKNIGGSVMKEGGVPVGTSTTSDAKPPSTTDDFFISW